MSQFATDRYFGERFMDTDKDVSRRRIDGAWLGCAEDLAIALDNATNNTSLALAIEHKGSRNVLLFPADAQVGNWLSWHDIKTTSDGQPFDVTELFERVVFYKVGHHGSANATLKGKGLELMRSNGLTAFLPVDAEMAIRKRWMQMPLPAIVEELQHRCGQQFIRMDRGPDEPCPANIVRGPARGGMNPLYYEWRVQTAPNGQDATEQRHADAPE